VKGRRSRGGGGGEGKEKERRREEEEGEGRRRNPCRQPRPVSAGALPSASRSPAPTRRPTPPRRLHHRRAHTRFAHLFLLNWYSARSSHVSSSCCCMCCRCMWFLDIEPLYVDCRPSCRCFLQVFETSPCRGGSVKIFN
jgi:hypothetical protein